MIHHGTNDSLALNGPISLVMFEKSTNNDKLEVHHNPEYCPAAMKGSQQSIFSSKQVPKWMDGRVLTLDNFTWLEVLMTHMLRLLLVVLHLLQHTPEVGFLVSLI